MNKRMTLALAPVVLGAGIALAPGASAHDQLIKTNPATGSQVTSAPSTLDLTFNESVLTMGNEIVVKGPNGKSSKPITPKVSGTVVSAPFTSSGNGAYTVTWRVVSADGHPVSGTFNFTLKGSKASGNTLPATSSPASSPSSASSGAATPGSATSPSSATSSTQSDKSDSTGNVWMWVLGGVVVVGLGCAAVVSRLRRTKGGGSASRSENLDDE